MPIRFSDSMINTALNGEFDEVSMDITTAIAEDESAEECDSLSEGQSASSLCSSQSDDALRATKLAFDVESEVTCNTADIVNSSEYAVDADEGFFDKQLGSPTSPSSGSSTPPPASHIMSHHSNAIENSTPLLIRGGTT